MEIGLVQGIAPKPEILPLPDGWQFGMFVDYKEAEAFAMAHGWAAKPQKVQVRQVPQGYIVERYDDTGCGCGG